MPVWSPCLLTGIRATRTGSYRRPTIGARRFSWVEHICGDQRNRQGSISVQTNSKCTGGGKRQSHPNILSQSLKMKLAQRSNSAAHVIAGIAPPEPVNRGALNFSPRALPDGIWGGNAAARSLRTGPNTLTPLDAANPSGRFLRISLGSDSSAGSSTQRRYVCPTGTR